METYIDYNDPENMERVKWRLEGKDPFFKEWDELPAGDRWDGMDGEDRIVHMLRMMIIEGEIDIQTAINKFLSFLY